MKLHADATATRITSYGPGYFAIGDRIVRQGIIIRADGTVAPWPPVVFSDLDEERVRLILAHEPEVALLGTGARQRFPAPGLLRPFVESGLGLEVMDTAAACRTFNVLASESREVVAALLPIEPLPGAGSEAVATNVSST